MTGVRSQTLLAAEHGAHRFTAGGVTTIVKVRFAHGTPPELADPATLADLEKHQPTGEIRRVWREKGMVEDLRLERRFELGPDGNFELGPMLAAYRRWRVFGAAEENDVA
jgi:hypothetical protein